MRARWVPRRGADGRLPEGPAKAHLVRQMFDAIAPHYDLLNRLMTLGLDQGWRRQAVAALGLPPGAVVLDLCCGTGDLSELAQRLGLVPVGLDVSGPMLAIARRRLPAVPLVRADAATLPLASASVDGLVCGFALRNVVDIPRVLDEVARVLRPGGRLVVLEMAEPTHGPLRLGHRLYVSTVVPLLGALLSDRAAYRYLPRSLAYLPPPRDLEEMVARAGFGNVRRSALSFGVAQVLVGTRR